MQLDLKLNNFECSPAARALLQDGTTRIKIVLLSSANQEIPVVEGDIMESCLISSIGQPGSDMLEVKAVASEFPLSLACKALGL